MPNPRSPRTTWRGQALLGVALALAAGLPTAIHAQASTAPASTAPAARAPRTILAIGAHAGDMELTAGAVLALQRERGDRVVLLHLTLGEGGKPALTPAEYGSQKRREAQAVADSLGAEVRFGPWADGQIPDDEAARRWVADAIRQVRPTNVITHWRASLHKDHATTHRVVSDAVLLASLPGVQTETPAWRGVRSVWYAENWEDAEGFSPYVFVNVTSVLDRWRRAVSQYEFARGGTGFRYVEYYDALATVRGLEARTGRAVAFEVDSWGKRRIVESMP